MALSAEAPDRLEELLATQLYLSGDSPGALDLQVFNELQSASIDSLHFPNLYNWYCYLTNYTVQARSSWEPAKPSPPAQEEEKTA